MYIPLHGHSTYSFLEALGQPKQIVKRARELGFTSIAITDFNGMYAIPSFFLAAQDAKDQENPDDPGFKAIFGLEIGFVMDIHASMIGKNIGNICLLAQNDEGYHNMMELIAYADQDGLSNGICKLDLQSLKEKSKGVICFTGGDLSWIAKMQASGESEGKIREVFDMIKDIFGERCYLEITAQDEKLFPDIRKCNQIIYKMAKETNTRLIVNNNYCYINPQDKEVREVALSIKDGTKMYDANRRKPAGQYHIMDGEEIRNICLKNGYKAEEIDERLNESGKIADTINASMLLHQKLFPKYETPQNIAILYEKYGDDSIIYED